MIMTRGDISRFAKYPIACVILGLAVLLLLISLLKPVKKVLMNSKED